MSSVTSSEVYAQLEATADEIGKLHHVLLRRLRHSPADKNPNSIFLTARIRELVDMELRLREFAEQTFSDPEPAAEEPEPTH